ncbi:hypothetical protein A8L34_07795 [Bacillus sp. FJAT-27264]|nr:hypothetical protein A8L34_07795 [Bacillus sp. FJAT-27264]
MTLKPSFAVALVFLKTINDTLFAIKSIFAPYISLFEDNKENKSIIVPYFPKNKLYGAASRSLCKQVESNFLGCS